jgi:hypothetical protein
MAFSFTGFSPDARIRQDLRSARRGPERGVAAGLLALALALAAVGIARADPSAPAAQGGGGAPSVMEIPLDIDLEPFFRKAESLLPSEAGHWRSWRRQRGVETRYRAWRGPLAMSLQGDLLTVQAHVRYWVRARKKLLGSLDVEVGCGLDEPPRQAVVGVQVRLGWGPDWALRPSFRVLPTRFIDRCEITLADIDVSPIIGRVFRSRMEASLRDALAGIRPRLDDARRRAAEVWEALQRPVELVPGVWLSAEPMAVALAPPYGSGRRLHTVLGLALEPRLDVRAPPSRPLRPLPALRPFFPRGSGMGFDIALAVNLDRVAEKLSSAFAGRELTLEGHRTGIGSLTLRGDGDELVVNARLTGDAAGRVEVWGRPVFDVESQSLKLTGIGFVFDPDDPDLALMANLFYQRIQSALEEGANALLAEHSRRLGKGVTQALARSLPDGLELDMGPLRLTGLTVEIGGDLLRLRGSAAGSMTLKAR